MNLPGGEISIERVVEWQDTDASGHYHHSTVIRWIEAEAALQEQLGLDELFGVTPRVHYEVDYLTRFWFRDRVTITLTVAEMGRTSLRYEFEVRRHEDLAAKGAMVAVHCGASDIGSSPWPGSIQQESP